MTGTEIALPDGADPEFSEGEWEADIDSPTGWYRCVWSPAFGNDDVRVVATQYLDGSLGTAEESPHVSLGSGEAITPAEARKAAAALNAAADLADKWAVAR
ncbi:hypothetical protein [Mycolicibacterium phocaicum]|uniref:Uncharacterized protein n=1 Tax=Mycolicibacterium phocaicum TaxID=319706 RepID=A0A7I7ZTD5_9MYCO|nr:hypothetical protein [Mycolicibacterium phocaicum]TLH61010.1 hypothetical protein C1S79_25820 [Mycolicibacterium phocaicum]BBZ57062.1 hypothetical protein MPHO_40540 [Mycolicibacterium phocaicum]